MRRNGPSKKSIEADEIVAKVIKYGMWAIPDGSEHATLRQYVSNRLGAGQYVSTFLPPASIVFITKTHIEKSLKDAATVDNILGNGSFEVKFSDPDD